MTEISSFKQDFEKIIGRPIDDGSFDRLNLGLLSDRGILYHKERGNIVIDPFKRENLATSSYDVSLGEHFYVPKKHHGRLVLYDPYDEEDVRELWGQPKQGILRRDISTKESLLRHLQQEAESRTPFSDADVYSEKLDKKLNNFADHERIFFIFPGEMILAHTQEYIGGRNGITTMMKARSSMGRNFIEVCKCAGMGDVGYTNRWTMEISNNGDNVLPLGIGRRIAQILFFQVGATLGDYTKTGNYQSTVDLEEIKSLWTPQQMLPKLYREQPPKN